MWKNTMQGIFDQPDAFRLATWLKTLRRRGSFLPGRPADRDNLSSRCRTGSSHSKVPRSLDLNIFISDKHFPFPYFQRSCCRLCWRSTLFLATEEGQELLGGHSWLPQQKPRRNSFECKAEFKGIFSRVSNFLEQPPVCRRVAPVHTIQAHPSSFQPLSSRRCRSHMEQVLFWSLPFQVIKTRRFS